MKGLRNHLIWGKGESKKNKDSKPKSNASGAGQDGLRALQYFSLTDHNWTEHKKQLPEDSEKQTIAGRLCKSEPEEWLSIVVILLNLLA